MNSSDVNILKKSKIGLLDSNQNCKIVCEEYNIFMVFFIFMLILLGGH